MTYTDKIKAGSKMYNYLTNMGGMEGGTEVLDIVYGGKGYTVRCSNIGRTKMMSIGVNEPFSLRSMNVDKITKQYVYLYSFDMMGTQTTYKMALVDMFLAED